LELEKTYYVISPISRCMQDCPFL